MKLLSLLSLLLILTSCHVEIKPCNSNTNISPENVLSTGLLVSGYQIDEEFFLKECTTSYDEMFCTSETTRAVIENVNEQLSAGFSIKGTTFATHIQDNETIMFTAGHLCNSMSRPNKHVLAVLEAFTFPRNNIKPMRPRKFRHIYDTNQRKYEIKEIFYANNNDPDVCMLSIEGHFPATVTLSDEEIHLGQSITNLAAPYGIFGNQSIVIFNGFFSGTKENNHVYSIPAAPGSSGSPVFHNNKLIGLIHSTDRRFNHISYGTSLRSIKDLILFQ